MQNVVSATMFLDAREAGNLHILMVDGIMAACKYAKNVSKNSLKMRNDRLIAVECQTTPDKRGHWAVERLKW